MRKGFEKGRLQPIAVSPGGAAPAFRIIAPRIAILTTTFALGAEGRTYFGPKISIAAAPVESW